MNPEDELPEVLKNDLGEIFDRLETLEQFDQERWETVTHICKHFDKLRKTVEEYNKLIAFFIQQNNQSSEIFNEVVAAQIAVLRNLKLNSKIDDSSLGNLEEAFAKMQIE